MPNLLVITYYSFQLLLLYTEHPLLFLKKIQQVQAAQDPAFAERLEIAQSSNPEVLIEGGGIPEDKGRTMPWNK